MFSMSAAAGATDSRDSRYQSGSDCRAWSNPPAQQADLGSGSRWNIGSARPILTAGKLRPWLREVLAGTRQVASARGADLVRRVDPVRRGGRAGVAGSIRAACADTVQMPNQRKGPGKQISSPGGARANWPVGPGEVRGAERGSTPCLIAQQEAGPRRHLKQAAPDRPAGPRRQSIGNTPPEQAEHVVS